MEVKQKQILDEMAQQFLREVNRYEEIDGQEFAAQLIQIVSIYIDPS